MKTKEEHRIETLDAQVKLLREALEKTINRCEYPRCEAVATWIAEDCDTRTYACDKHIEEQITRYHIYRQDTSELAANRLAIIALDASRPVLPVNGTRYQV